MRKLPFLVLLVVLALVAAWFDWIPGGWRLRELIVGRELLSRDAYLTHRRERLAQFASEPAAREGSIVFLGSSTIENFPLDQCFPGSKVLNRGIGNEPLADLQERLETSVPATAGGVVLYAGSVDFRTAPAKSDELAAQIGALLARLDELRPDLVVCVLGVLPERGMDSASMGSLSRLNDELSRICAERGASFVATDRPPLRDASGLAESFSSDRLHLAAEGYTVLARWIVDEGGPVGRSLAP